MGVTLAPVLLHAFGARYDLPAPLWLFLVGAGAVVFLSFLLVVPRPVSRDIGVNLSPREAPPSTAVQWVFLAIGILLAFAGIFGAQSIPDNILPTAFWLVFWIAVPISIAVAGNYWPYISPLHLIARLTGTRIRREYPDRLGYWPATVLFFLFACSELVFNEVTTLPAVTALIMIGYGLLTALMAWLFGAEAWLERGEVFSVLFRTWGRLGWFRLGEPGRPGFFGGLTHPFESTVARLTFVLLLLVSVSFDGLLATPAWRNFRTTLPSAMQPGTAAYAIFLVLTFIVLTLIIWGLFGGFALAVKAVGGLDERLIDVVAGLVPSVVPIAFGYLVAHNADYLAINGQLLIHQASDPLGIGWNIFGTVEYEPNRNLVPTAAIWYFQIALIIAVHIAAVVLAHNYLGRAARTEPQGKRAELPWIVAMVGYTMSSLWLLAQPIVQEGRGG